MRYPRKCNLGRTVLFFVVAIVMTAMASAQENRTCSAASVAGEWGYSETGTLYLPTGPVPYASLGRYVLDRDGNYSGSRTASAGGTIQAAAFKGTATVNPDCTGTVTINFFDESGNLAGTAVKTIVYVNNAREARAMITSLVLANGVNLPGVLITEARKIFPGHQH